MGTERMWFQNFVLSFILLSISQSLAASELKPFAEKHVILQVSDANPAKYTAVLDIANNLIKHYNGPDFIDIEIIAFGKGVEMYYSELGSKLSASHQDENSKENPNKVRVSSLIDNGVRFYVCLNTLDTIQRKTGKRPKIIEGVKGVQTGVAFMLEEITNGYTHIHP